MLRLRFIKPKVQKDQFWEFWQFLMQRTLGINLNWILDFSTLNEVLVLLFLFQKIYSCREFKELCKKLTLQKSGLMEL